MQPSVRAFFHVGIIPFGVPAIVPIVGSLSLRLDLHSLPLLDVNNRSRRSGNSRGIPIRLRISVVRCIAGRRIAVTVSVAIRRWIIRRPVGIVAQAIT